MIVGDNGQGKTNLLESIAYLAEVDSFRGAPTDAVVRIGATTAVVRADVARDEVPSPLIEAEAGVGRSRVQVNRQLNNFPGSGTAIAGRDQLAAAGISPGVMKPVNALGGERWRRRGCRGAPRARPASTGDRRTGWQDGTNALVEAFPSIDGAAPGIQAIIDRSTAALAEPRDRHRPRRRRPRLPARVLAACRTCWR